MADTKKGSSTSNVSGSNPSNDGQITRPAPWGTTLTHSANDTHITTNPPQGHNVKRGKK